MAGVPKMRTEKEMEKDVRLRCVEVYFRNRALTPHIKVVRADLENVDLLYMYVMERQLEKKKAGRPPSKPASSTAKGSKTTR